MDVDDPAPARSIRKLHDIHQLTGFYVVYRRPSALDVVQTAFSVHDPHLIQ